MEERRQLIKKTLDPKSPSLNERAVAQYREKDKQAKIPTRRDKRQYVERFATESEVAVERKDMKTVYQITRQLRDDRGQNQDLAAKGNDGSTITEESAKLERLREHFQQLLKRCDPPALADISETEQDLDIELGPITVQLVKDVIKKLMIGRALEDDNEYAEMLKAEQEMSQLLQHILQDVLDKEIIHDACKRGTIIILPQKWNLSKCSN